MQGPSRSFRWPRGVLPYLGTAALGAFAVFGGFVPSQWLVGWVWWQRLGLVLLASPLLLLAYAALAGLVEAGLRTIARALQRDPMPALIALVISTCAFLYATLSLFHRWVA